ncbi:T-complex 11 [Delitschia confertaspora ATCC 74209]|uniref:T-complex 11 n=1 Tax=Delitschia confertaspora ATCC 74209 TaxID=1513339 RepID=A0A9P4JMU8_9PLEO|nr:T-complex 11 [Delitschia confertaspora ATCC 74209]
MPSNAHTISEQLAELISKNIEDPRGEELNDAFQHAGKYPPITRQSLSELDIQNIINNIKLRHDVNFDRDLSFRPNLDGTKGQEKMKAAKRYWNALCAELELFTVLFRQNPLNDPRNDPWQDAHFRELVKYAKRRIPIMFQTIREVLKSLVPDRDQSRVDEHLDVAMLMQEIENGACDLVRFAQWLAQLLKEHCAPMRDEWVDKMVGWTKDGVSKGSSESIVNGLRELLGILEAMKLDVANHQIRNLRGLLIEDTVNFERNYHLGKLVQGRARINLEAAQHWYSSEGLRLRHLCTSPLKDSTRLQLEVFIRAVVSLLFSQDPHNEFPETFYLDQDRLRNLRAGVHDLVFFEICFTLFSQLLTGLGHQGPIPPTTRHILRTSLTAILGGGTVHSVHQWLINCEYISLELVRHALHHRGFLHTYNANLVGHTSYVLRKNMLESFREHADELEASFSNRILACVNSHIHSSPLDLFNALIVSANPPPPPPPPPGYSGLSIQQPVTDVLPAYADHSSDLVNRVSHIILLHWQTWGTIAYVTEDERAISPPISTSPEMSETGSNQPPPTNPLNHLAPVEESTSTGAVVPTKEPSAQDSQQDTQIAGSMSGTSSF